MNRGDQAQDLRANRADSIARRPHLNPLGATAVTPGQYQGRAKLPSACIIEIDRLIPDSDQPRKTFPDESIDQLAASFRQRGQLVPILARWSPEADRYIVVDGERRFRAAERAGLTTLSAVDVTGKSPEDILEIQLVTNALREDVPAVEQAKAYRALIEAKGYTHRDLADRLNLAHTTITRSLGLLDLSPSLQAQVDEGRLSARAGYEIAQIEDPEKQAEVAEVVISNKMNKAEAIEAVRRAKESKSAGAGGSKGRGPIKGNPKPPKARTFIMVAGWKIMVTPGRGATKESLEVALRAALNQVLAEIAAQGSAPPDQTAA